MQAAAAALSPAGPSHDSDSELAGASTGGDSGGLTAYELERQQHIARNRARLAALQLPDLAAELAAEAAAAAHPHKQRRRAAEKKPRAPRPEPGERRQSSRLRGVAPDGATAAGVEAELRGGQVVLASGVGSIWGPYNASGTGSVQDPPKPRHPQGPVPFDSGSGDSATDAGFLELLRSAAAGASGGGAARSDRAKGVVGVGSSAAEAAKLQLAQNDVAKLVKDGVTCLAFCPGAARPLLAAADKGGQVRYMSCSLPGSCCCGPRVLARRFQHSSPVSSFPGH